LWPKLYPLGGGKLHFMVEGFIILERGGTLHYPKKQFCFKKHVPSLDGGERELCGDGKKACTKRLDKGEARRGLHTSTHPPPKYPPNDLSAWRAKFFWDF